VPNENVQYSSGVATFIAAAKKALWDGDQASLQLAELATTSGSSGSRVLQTMSGNTTPSPTAYTLGVRQAASALPRHIVTAAGTNVANIKASPGVVTALNGFNIADYPIFVKFHDTAGVPTVGVGVVATFALQAGLPLPQFPPGGIKFEVGIGISIVKDVTDAGVNPVALADGVVDVYFE
jgi:hypothetical protein